MNYIPKYREEFVKDIKKYSGMKKQIEKKVKAILEDPYHNTEQLKYRAKYNLKGFRSKRIDKNFRILFAICEECKELFESNSEENLCKYCDPDFPEKTVVFFLGVVIATGQKTTFTPNHPFQ